MVNIIDAARYTVYVSYNREKHTLTNLKLQKILYLVQGWSFVWDGVPAFCGDFSLWGTGPVSQKVYDVFSKYGRDQIPECEGINTIPDKDIMDTIDAVWKEYGGKSAYYIAERAVRGLIPADTAKESYIPDESIARVFHDRFV